MRALITGGKGFVGQWLATHLKDCGDEVVVIDVETDVADGDALRRVMAEAAPEAIYHLAAMTHVGESWENPSQVLRVNVLGTAEMLAAARACSTSAPVCWWSARPRSTASSPRPLPLREDTPTAPATPYAASKLAAEAVALQAWRGYRAAGDRRAAVQPHRPGPVAQLRRAGAWPSASWRPGAVAPGRSAVGKLTTRRDFTDVRDVVVAYRLLIEQGAPRRPSTTSARDGTWPSPRWPTAARPGRRRPRARDRSRPGAPGRRTRAAGRRGAAHGGHRLGAPHPARDNARRRPGLLGGGLTASAVRCE